MRPVLFLVMFVAAIMAAVLPTPATAAMSVDYDQHEISNAISAIDSLGGGCVDSAVFAAPDSYSRLSDAIYDSQNSGDVLKEPPSANGVACRLLRGLGRGLGRLFGRGRGSC